MIEGISVHDFEGLANKFAADMRRSGKSEYTIRIYMWASKSLVRYADANGHIINRDSLEGWQDSLYTRWSPHSIGLAGTAVRQCLEWAARNEHIHDERLARAVPKAKYSRYLPSTLTPSTLTKLEYFLHTQVEKEPKNVHYLRDRALFFYVKSTAARVSEILQVRRDNFERQVVRQKGGDAKALTAPPGVAGLIREYLRTRRDDNEWLWVAFNTNGSVTKLQDAGVLKIWERLARRAGVRRFTTQELRHTAATLLVERGHDDSAIMEFLGARDIRSVQPYKTIVADRLARMRADLDVVY